MKNLLLFLLLLVLGSFGCQSPSPQPSPTPPANKPSKLEPTGGPNPSTNTPASNLPSSNLPASNLPSANLTPLIPPPLPRILVYMKGDKADELESDMEEVFKNAQFDVRDRTQIQNIKEVDAALSSNDPAKLTSLKNRYGIEVIVVARVRWTMTDSNQIYGRSVNMYKGSVSVKAVESDTAKVIYSKHKRTLPSSSDRVLIRALNDLSKIVAEKLRQHWAQEKYRGKEIDVVISKVAYEHLKTFDNYLKTISRITSAARRNYSNQTAFYSIGIRGSARELEKSFMDCPYLSFNIVRTTTKRIEMELTGKKAEAPPETPDTPDTNYDSQTPPEETTPPVSKTPAPPVTQPTPPVTQPDTTPPAKKENPSSGVTPPKIVGSTGSAVVSWTIYNDSDNGATMEYQLLGSSSNMGSVVIPPRGKKTVTLSGGRYMITVNSNVGDVLPYNNSFEFVAGKKYENRCSIRTVK